MTLLNKKEIFKKLEDLNGWVYLNNTLSKHLKFQTYMDSISFINEIAKKADQLNHHPDMIVGWCTIKISFTSHDKGGVTQRCIEMAKFVNSLV